MAAGPQRPKGAPSNLDYWLRRCEGFRVDWPQGRVGFVEEVRYASRCDRPDVIAVRAGLRGFKTCVPPASPNFSRRELSFETPQGANCLPAALLFLALGALAFALLPRTSAGIAYALVGVAFVWQEFGSALGAPSWTLDLSPFHHVGLVPAEPFKAVGAVVMLAIAAVASLAATRRDLTGT